MCHGKRHLESKGEKTGSGSFNLGQHRKPSTGKLSVCYPYKRYPYSVARVVLFASPSGDGPSPFRHPMLRIEHGGAGLPELPSGGQTSGWPEMAVEDGRCIRQDENLRLDPVPNGAFPT